jgi:hypothetical protein
MRRIKTTPSFTETVRGMKAGEVAKVHTTDCKETVLRNIVCRLKREGYSYRVNAADGYCIVTRLA